MSRGGVVMVLLKGGLWVPLAEVNCPRESRANIPNWPASLSMFSLTAKVLYLFLFPCVPCSRVLFVPV